MNVMSYSELCSYQKGLVSFIKLTALLLLSSCTQTAKDTGVTFMVADPGHFHAALVLKSIYPGVNRSVYVYAPDGPELRDFETRVEGYTKRADNPAPWEIKEFRGPDFFERMIKEKQVMFLSWLAITAKRRIIFLTPCKTV